MFLARVARICAISEEKKRAWVNAEIVLHRFKTFQLSITFEFFPDVEGF